MKKEYTFEDIMKARDTERERIRIIIEWIINNNSRRVGFDYKKFLDDIQDLEETLISKL